MAGTKCTCADDVDAALRERNTRLTRAITFSDRGNNPNLMLRTEQIETGRGKPKAIGAFLSYCPFCGTKYDAGDSTPTAVSTPQTSGAER
jgi:hypothetical protein